jgi:hypothetical protein
LTHILAGRAANLAVLPLDGVGWSDLGRPGRVLAALAYAGTTAEWADRVFSLDPHDFGVALLVGPPVAPDVCTTLVGRRP